MRSTIRGAYMYGRDSLTLEDYLESPILATPFRILDRCLETDGACAVFHLARARP